MFDFTDKVVLVTGAAGNLGQAVSLAFYAAGGSLVLVGRRREKLVDLFGTQIPEGERGLYVSANLTDENSVAEMVAAVMARYGRIDILVNIAGGFAQGTSVHETAVETWDFMLDLNARTTFLLSRAVAQQMVKAQQGKIVNVSARAGLAGKANMAPYSVSKSAVIRLTESMAAELKDQHINVNCILPGTIDTPRNRAEMPNADFNKWVTTEALADVILFLASDAARGVNGASLPVYGRS